MMTRPELWEKPTLEWMEPAKFRAQRPGEQIRIRWPSHGFFLIIALGYILYCMSTEGMNQLGAETLIRAIALGMLCAYVPLLAVKYQPQMVRFTRNGIFCLRFTQAVILPTFYLVRVNFENISNCVITPASCDGAEIDSLIFFGRSDTEILKVGLSGKVKRIDVIEQLKSQGVPCEEAT